MTARQPRGRRQGAPARALPRPGAPTRQSESGPPPETLQTIREPRMRRREGPVKAWVPREREHHVTTDFSHVRRDLVIVAGVSAITLAFILGMSFIVG